MRERRKEEMERGREWRKDKKVEAGVLSTSHYYDFTFGLEVPETLPCAGYLVCVPIRGRLLISVPDRAISITRL